MAEQAASCGPPGRPRPVTIQCRGGRELSGLLAEPVGPVRATVVALHGAGMCSRYFDADGGDRSFLRSGAGAGLRVLALDRPGYGLSAHDFPDGMNISEQAVCIADAVRDLRLDSTGLTLLGHSFGSKVALAIAADGRLNIDHIEFAGLGHRYAADPMTIAARSRRAVTSLHWGPVRCYPPGTFTIARSHGIVQDTPPVELADAVRWPSTIRGLAARVPCTVHASFAQFERWWHATPDDIRSMTALFGDGSFSSSIIPDTGHNSSLGYTAPRYHRDVAERILSTRRQEQGRAARTNEIENQAIQGIREGD